MAVAVIALAPSGVGSRSDGGAVLDRVLGESDEDVFQRRLLGGQFEDGDPGRARGGADLGGGGTSDRQRAVGGGSDGDARSAKLPGEGVGIGAADPDRGRRGLAP